MDSLKRKKLTQLSGLLVAVGILAILLAVNAMRPSEEEQEVADISDAIMARDWENVTPEERQQFRKQWERMSPDTREKIWEQVSRQRLQQIRQKTAGMKPEDRVELIKKRVKKLRERHRNISDEERVRIKERLTSEDGKQMVRKMMNFYHKELSAKERAEMDPLLHEWMYQIQDLTR